MGTETEFEYTFRLKLYKVKKDFCYSKTIGLEFKKGEIYRDHEPWENQTTKEKMILIHHTNGDSLCVDSDNFTLVKLQPIDHFIWFMRQE